jgi:hypothetical protein
LAAALAPGGVLVFDYVGDRYTPDSAEGVTEWPEIYRGEGGDIAVIDRRTRLVSPISGTAMSISHCTCEVRDARTGELVGQAHAYDKLIAPDALLTEQFADAGLELTNLGGIADLSPYFRDRISRRDDLGCWVSPTASTKPSRCE